MVVGPDGRVLGRGRSTVYTAGDLIGHAEIRALREAGSLLMVEPYTGACILYGSLEPCLMCTGALFMARIARVVWATDDALYGALRRLHRSALVEGGWLYYRVENVLLGQEDGETTLTRLEQQVVRGSGLSAEERLDLVFLPLMRHQRPRAEVVRTAVELAARLPADQQRQTLASLIGLGHRFLAGAELETLLEGLMGTSLGQQLIERGYEQGVAQGVAQERRQVMLRVLTQRFGALPPVLGVHLAQIEDLQRLETLLDRAFTANTVAVFTAALDH